MSETKLTRYNYTDDGKPYGLHRAIMEEDPDGDYYLASDADARIAEQSQAHADIEAEMGAVIINANRRIADLERERALIKEAALGERNLRLAAERERDELRKRVGQCVEAMLRTAAESHTMGTTFQRGAAAACESAAAMFSAAINIDTPHAAQGAQP
jgi:hypothetical protein